MALPFRTYCRYGVLPARVLEPLGNTQIQIAMAVTLWILGALVATTSPTPECEPSSQRPGTCQLQWSALAEGMVWATSAVSLGAAFLIDHKLGDEAHWTGTLALEDSISRELRLDPAGSKKARRASDVFAYYLAPVGFGVFEAVTMLTADRPGFPFEALEDIYIVVTSTTLTVTTTFLLKATARRLRPSDPASGRPNSRVHSFPSGHTSMAFALASSMSTTAYLRGYSAWWLLPALGGASAATVGYLRIAAGAHWFLDVVAGAGLGTAIGMFYPLLAHPRKSGNTAQVRRWQVVPHAGGLGLVWRLP